MSIVWFCICALMPEHSVVSGPPGVSKRSLGEKGGGNPQERLCVDKCLTGIGVFVDLFRNWCP